MSGISELLNLAGPPICSQQVYNKANAYPECLSELLLAKNGFYLFESALLIRPFGEIDAPSSLATWNNPLTWMDGYDPCNCFFFAEDLFGTQFGVKDNRIYQFDPETGELNLFRDSIEDWAQSILSDRDFLTGYPIACEWQSKFGPIERGIRLIPKQPFVLGGEYSLPNLIPKNEIVGMRIRAGFASHLKALPDGSSISFTFE